MTRTRKITQPIAEGGLCAAMATLLSLFHFYEASAGGAVTPASMLPVVLYAVRWGVPQGVTAGLVVGLLHGLIKGYFLINAWSFILDYCLAFMVIGLAGVFFRKPSGLLWGGALAGVLKFTVHWLSGIIFWAKDAAEGQAVWLYSVLYNGTYMLPETLILVGVAGLVSVPLRKLIVGDDL